MAASHPSGKPVHRPLKVFAFDPTRGKSLGNHMTVNAQFEELTPGPVGRQLMVVDYDASNGCYYPPVDLNDPSVLLRGGIDPSETDPHFHQQMVYAVASETIRRFEFALGRRVKWRFPSGKKDDPHRKLLRIFPHGMQEANAFYSRDLRALVFGYFTAALDEAGSNLPGQTVFTCLSHDIIAHETTHALIDGLRAYFNEATGPDTLAFHEAFADLVALFQHFSYKEVLLDTIQKTGGAIHRLEMKPDIAPAEGPQQTDGKREPGQPSIQAELSTPNPLAGLAQQFGEAVGLRGMLRSALGTRPNTNDLAKVTEPHARGSILVAAVFDAFFTVYLRRIRDLLRIARTGGPIEPDYVHPDLANRMAEEASKLATHFSNICIRALDYCPPVDILFGDFLRAIITSDAELVPDDDLGYRAALIDAFRSRGIRPQNVTSYSEESLLWSSPEQLYGHAFQCEGLVFDGLREPSPARQKRNAVLLHQFADANRKWMGLSSRVDPKTRKPCTIHVHSFHPFIRVGPDDGMPEVQFFVEFMQQRQELYDPSEKNGPRFTFRGGTTVVFDQNGCVRYAIQKSLDNAQRLQQQRDYYQQTAEGSGMAIYSGKLPEIEHLNFAAIHRGF